MTLIHFLNSLRKSGGDITRLRVVKPNAWGSAWEKGLNVAGLRGNRLSVEFQNNNHELMAGHSCLNCEVESISRVSLGRRKKLSGSIWDSPAILVTIRERETS